MMEALPIACADLVIVSNGKFLLGKRKNSPAKGQWYPPGGRILKGEKIESAAKRKAKEEVGLNIRVKDLKYLMNKETIFRNPSRHTINSVFSCEISEAMAKKVVADDSQIEKLEWFNKIHSYFPPYVKNILSAYKAKYKK